MHVHAGLFADGLPASDPEIIFTQPWSFYNFSMTVGQSPLAYLCLAQ